MNWEIHTVGETKLGKILSQAFEGNCTFSLELVYFHVFSPSHNSYSYQLEKIV